MAQKRPRAHMRGAPPDRPHARRAAMFADGDADGDADEPALAVNEDYARRYKARKEKEELSRLRQAHERSDGDASESESSEEEREDEDGVLWTSDADRKLLETLAALKVRHARRRRSRERAASPAPV